MVDYSNMFTSTSAEDYAKDLILGQLESLEWISITEAVNEDVEYDPDHQAEFEDFYQSISDHYDGIVAEILGML